MLKTFCCDVSGCCCEANLVKPPKRFFLMDGLNQSKSSCVAEFTRNVRSRNRLPFISLINLSAISFVLNSTRPHPFDLGSPVLLFPTATRQRIGLYEAKASRRSSSLNPYSKFPTVTTYVVWCVSIFSYYTVSRRARL